MFSPSVGYFTKDLLAFRDQIIDNGVLYGYGFEWNQCCVASLRMLSNTVS
jgi:hypothetical protein